MGHTPKGYRIEMGIAVIDEIEADKIRSLYNNYLSGMSLRAAAKQAGIDTYHVTAKRIISNRHYIGDDYYPAIISSKIFNKAQMELKQRAIKLGRINKAPTHTQTIIPTRFKIASIDNCYDDPVLQAEFAYSLIEGEVS